MKAQSNFEQYLIDSGWRPHVVGYKNRIEVLNPGYTFYSTMGTLHHCFIKGGKRIYFGLNEYGRPPILISPLPNIYLIESKYNRIYMYQICDDYVNRVLAKYSPQEVLEAMFNREIILYP